MFYLKTLLISMYNLVFTVMGLQALTNAISVKYLIFNFNFYNYFLVYLYNESAVIILNSKNIH